MLNRLRTYWQDRRANRPRRFARLRERWRERTNRRRFIKGALIIGSTGAATAGYMRFWEPGWLEINRHNVPFKGGGEPLRLLHLSDLHASRVVSLGYLRRALAVGLEHQPDLICLTGDYITWKYHRFEEYARVLATLSQTAPTFACLGNHDGGRWAGGRLGYADANHMRRTLEQAGIILLHNTSRGVVLKGSALNLAGVGDLWNDECQPAEAFKALPHPVAPTIVLSHNPDTKQQLASHDWQLMLCGHTHGGQLYVPGLGAPFAPVRDKRYGKGLHAWQDRWIHITKGVGNVHGLRLNCRPEVSMLTLS